ncbi:MAG: DUF3313 family protein, partial [Candidatus Bathyanammoxibius sp.]
MPGIYGEDNDMQDGRITGLLLTALSVLGLCFMVSCAAKPHQQSGFLKEYSDMKQTKNFHRLYIDPDVDFGTYENVVVRPVDTSHIEKQTWYDMTYNEKELAEIIEFIEKEFARTLGASYLIVNDDGGFTGKTLVLETSLIDLDPVDKYSNTMSSALIYIPVSKGKVAMEGRMIDAGTRKTVLKFADARHG